MKTKAEKRLIRQWEEDLIRDYSDYRSHQLLDPLYEQFQQWKAGEMSHDDLFEAIHEMHRANQERFTFFHQKKAEVVRWIQFDPWFDAWLEEHPSPEGADLVPPELKTDRWEEEEEESQADIPPETLGE